jgi:uncharacterized protein YhbP (UPF0306 family)
MPEKGGIQEEDACGNEIPERIEKFIRKHHVMTVATVQDGRAWCAHVFYAWMHDEGLFVFTTDTSTRHGREMLGAPQIAAAIALETKKVGIIQGLQLEGAVKPTRGGEDDAEEMPDVAINAHFARKAQRAYLRRFPYAALSDLSLWVLRPTRMKLTDNRLGFGKKLLWEAECGDE